MQPRAERLLDAAIQVVGTEGIRALTHRAVDAAAGLPAGSTSNLYRTREALLRAMTRRMVDTEIAGWEQLASAKQPATVDSLTELLAATVAMLVGPMRTLTVARYAVFVEGVRDEALQAEIGRAAGRVAAIGVRWLGLLGSAYPARDTATLMAYLDGLLVHLLAFPEPAPPLNPHEVATEIRTLLRALVRAG